MEISKKYDPKEVEGKWYKSWTDKEYFRPSMAKGREPFCMVIPPPNITGSLHMGHALNNTIQDILTRWKRMQGCNTLWLPGTDHAGIATQNVVEREIAKVDLSRHEMGREKFVETVWKWREETGDTIINQLKKLGSSCDWSRQRFTMDEGLSRAVQQVFIKLYNEGYIYRGNYIINWCPRCQTALSDLEAEHKEINGLLYYVKYLFTDDQRWTKNNGIVVATTRPETIFGDIAIAVNPADKRYKELVGKTVNIPGPCGDRIIPIIKDSYVDMAFGTGALKITPAHDRADFEIGQRHKLKPIAVIDIAGKMNRNAGRYEGMDRFECRKALVEDLKKEGCIEKIEDYASSVGVCYRCNTYVEPYLSKQWFVKMKELAAPAIKAVKEGKIEFVPKNWEKTYFQWMENIRDWCISRQIWWGHRIPVWYCDGDKMCKPIASATKPKRCPKCDSMNLIQDEDVLDTWFSSALWPFSTLGWPDKTEDLNVFYPTAVLSTGFDIIFFWVARMIMMGIHFMGEVPFRTVYIHALIRDAEGQKMSKSKGNIVDPLGVIDQYGTDALRFTLAALAVKGRDIFLSEERIQGYRNFMNKIWNAYRLMMTNLDQEAHSRETGEASSKPTTADKWIVSRLNQATSEVTACLEEYDFDKACAAIYEFFWHEFCDWYIEISKLQMAQEELRASTIDCFYRVLEQSLRLMHPFIPFITEEIWQETKKTVKGIESGVQIADSIMVSEWPKSQKRDIDDYALLQMEMVKEVVTAVRNIRSELNIPPVSKIKVLVSHKDDSVMEMVSLIEASIAYVKGLAGIGELEVGRGLPVPRPAAVAVVKGVDIYVPLQGIIDTNKEKERLEKRIEKAKGELSKLESRLSSDAFIKKAPKDIVAKEQGRKAEIQASLEKLTANLKMLA